MQIMKGWREKKFVVLQGLVSDIAVLLTDIQFWADHHEELNNWCEEHNSRQEGMMIVFPDAKTLSIFCLRWS